MPSDSGVLRGADKLLICC
ncbi:rCG60173, partial [Rattus norvegicus]